MRKIILIMITVISIFIVNKVRAYTEYKIGDMVSYNNIDYYVIKDSSSTEDSVTMLKAEPLSYVDVETYSVGTGATIYDNNGYGRMKYHASSSAYNGSYVKTTVEAWKTAKAPAATEARLITVDEVSSLGYEWFDNGSVAFWKKTEYTPSWLYNSNYSYWTMSQYNDSASNVFQVAKNGDLGTNNFGSVSSNDGVVLPVIVLSKTSLGDADESDINEDSSETTIPDNQKKDSVSKVSVPNTYMKTSIIIIIFGFIFIASGVILFYRKANKREGKK